MPENYIYPIFGFLYFSIQKHDLKISSGTEEKKNVGLGLLKSLVIYNLSKADEIELPVGIKMLKGIFFFYFN